MRTIYIVTLLFITQFGIAQTNFINNGIITFERRVSQFKINEKEGNEGEDFWKEEMKKVMTKTLSDIFILNFNEKQSFYHLAKENAENKYMFGNLKPVETDFIAQNFSTETTILLKSIFENQYQINDSIKKFEWKITGEVRTIAGFECKKAVTKICDSVVVVAFYTDQILVKGGPENFNGLPGMIMGIAIPRLASTWFATKVELNNNPIIIPSTKGKKGTFKDMNKEITKGMSNWGDMGASIVWMANL